MRNIGDPRMLTISRSASDLRILSRAPKRSEPVYRIGVEDWPLLPVAHGAVRPVTEGTGYPGKIALSDGSPALLIDRLQQVVGLAQRIPWQSGEQVMFQMMVLVVEEKCDKAIADE